MGLRIRQLASVSALLLFVMVAACTNSPSPPPPPPPPPVEASPSPEPLLPSFPLPAPKPSARYVFDRTSFPATTTLGVINGRIRKALTQGKYSDYSYFVVPAGFAVVAQMERIKPNGAPWPDPGRWKSAPSSLGDGSFSLSGFLSALRNSDAGRYRVIVFVVTTKAVTTTGPAPDVAEVREWLNEGGNVLPAQIAARPFTPEHDVTALVYEFERASVGSEPKLVTDGGLTGSAHLGKAGLLPL